MSEYDDEKRSFGASKRRGTRREGRADRPVPRPYDAPQLEALALHYVAKFATTGAKLEAYLARKLRERGFAAGEDEDGLEAGRALIATLVAKFVAVGYIDDASYATAKSGSLLRQGMGRGRIAQALSQAGVEEELRHAAMPDEYAARCAALALARKRGLGPFARGRAGDDGDASEDDMPEMPEDGDGDEPRAGFGQKRPAKPSAWARGGNARGAAQALRQKQLAVFMRAGHSMAHAQAVLDSPDAAAANAWVEAAASPDWA